jgi:hypothetical protein
MLWDVHVYNVDGTHEALLQTTQMSTISMWSSPAVGDADNDGRVEIWAGGGCGSDPGVGHLWRFESDAVDVGESPWPSFHRDAQNTGYHAPPRLDTRPTSLYVMHEYGSGSSETRALFLSNKGDGEIVWEASSSPVGVSVDPDSGETDWTGTSVAVSISTTGLVTDTYDFGEIVFVGTKGGEEVEGSPVDIPVTLYVGHIRRLFFPVAMRNGN